MLVQHYETTESTISFFIFSFYNFFIRFQLLEQIFAIRTTTIFSDHKIDAHTDTDQKLLERKLKCKNRRSNGIEIYLKRFENWKKKNILLTRNTSYLHIAFRLGAAKDVKMGKRAKRRASKQHSLSSLSRFRFAFVLAHSLQFSANFKFIKFYLFIYSHRWFSHSKACRWMMMIGIDGVRL